MEFHLLAMRDPGPQVREEGTFKATWNHDDAVRGYGAKAEKSVSTHRFFRGEKLIFDKTYTHDYQGRRITPSAPEADTALVFFGCSFTYGIGVQDTECYPYRVGALLGGNFQVFSMGFTGYGSHQLLASLESGVLDNMAQQYKNVHVFYLNIRGHEMRPAGYSEWDLHGPQYILKDGKAIRAGNFDHWWNRGALNEAIYKTLKKSFLFSDLFIRPREWALAGMRVLDNTLIRQSRDLVQKKYPNADFTPLVYADAPHHIPLLRELGLTPLDTTPFFPFPPSDPRYTIPEEWHPSPEAHRVLAEGIAAEVLARHSAPALSSQSASGKNENGSQRKTAQ